MRRLSRLFIATLMLAAPVGLTAYPLLPSAEAAVLSPEQVAAFRAKLDAAEAGRGSLTKRAGCLDAFVKDLQARSAASERALGDARRREQQLTAQVANFEQQQRGFSQQVDAETRNYNSKRQEFERARSKYQEQESRLRKCSSVLGRGLCKFGEDVVKSTGIMDDAKKQFESTERRLQSARNGLTDMQNKLRSSGNELSQARAVSAANQKSITELEAQISRAKAANSTINIKIQDYNSLLVNFENTLKDAGEVDPNDARKRQVDRLSSEVDALASGLPAFAASVDLGLPEDAKARCPR